MRNGNLGEVTYIKVKRTDLRRVFGLSDASQSDLSVWLDRTQNEEVLATIADDLIEGVRFSVNGGIRIVEVSLNVLVESKSRFKTDPLTPSNRLSILRSWAAVPGCDTNFKRICAVVKRMKEPSNCARSRVARIVGWSVERLRRKRRR
jgi:hypothetical protein